MTVRSWLSRARQRAVVRRACVSAAVVGPVLVAINYGDHIMRGEVSGSAALKMALTVIVPYCVSTFSSVEAGRT